MGFKLAELLGKTEIEEPTPTKVVKKRYFLELEYVMDRQGNPIYSGICKVKIRGFSERFELEEKVRPYSRRDNLLADASYWDKSLFKVFYRKLLDHILKNSVLYTPSEREIKSWEKACKELGIMNAYILQVNKEIDV